MTNSALNIAVVEDNDDLREVLVSYLSQPGRQVFGVDCGEALNELMKQHPISVLILDLSLPHEDGFSITRRLKQAHPHIRIAMLTARARPSDRTQAYETGVDIFLTKPTNPRELEAVVSNFQMSLPTPVPIKPDEVIPLAIYKHPPRVTSADGRCVDLTPRDVLLLTCLCMAPNREMHSETLTEEFLKAGFPDFGRKNQVVVVSRLRAKMEENGFPPNVLFAVRNYGYRLNLPLVVI